MVLPSIPGSAIPNAAPGGAYADAGAAPDFAQVLEALLSPARAIDPALVGDVVTGDAPPDAPPTAQGEDLPPDGSAGADLQVLPTPQAMAQATVIPTATLAPSIQSGAQTSERTGATPNPPALIRGPTRAFEVASDEPVQKRAALELAPGAPASPAKIAVEPMQATALEAAGSLSPVPDAPGSPSTVPPDHALSLASGSDLLGMAPAERAGRETGAVTPADSTRAGVRIDAPDFADEFGSRVVWMAGRNQQSAEFRIDPPQLGPVEVRLSLSNDQASLVLLSPHASVRDALQATLPRLHDLLAAAGINLGSVHVGAHGQSGGHPREQPAPGLHTSPDAGLPATIQASSWVAHGRGMVDIYA
jgi:flagellar hook-length control protein FliK